MKEWDKILDELKKYKGEFVLEQDQYVRHKTEYAEQAGSLGGLCKMCPLNYLQFLKTRERQRNSDYDLFTKPLNIDYQTVMDFLVASDCIDSSSTRLELRNKLLQTLEL